MKNFKLTKEQERVLIEFAGDKCTITDVAKAFNVSEDRALHSLAYAIFCADLRQMIDKRETNGEELLNAFAIAIMDDSLTDRIMNVQEEED